MPSATQPGGRTAVRTTAARAGARRAAVRVTAAPAAFDSACCPHQPLVWGGVSRGDGAVDAGVDLASDAAPELIVGVACGEACDDTTRDIQPDVCVRDCNGKVCRDDGCGGSCGECADGWLCSPQGLCEP